MDNIRHIKYRQQSFTFGSTFMKKTLLYLLLSITGVAILFGVTAIVTGRIENSPQDKIRNSSELYEILEFIPPDRTVYSLTETYREYYDNSNYRELVKFDGTGMSMTVQNKVSGEVKTYKYISYEYYVGDEKVQSGKNLFFDFTPEENTYLKEGEYTTYVYLLTDDGEIVITKMKFNLVDETKEGATKIPNQKPKNETVTEPSLAQPQGEDIPALAEPIEKDEDLVIKDITGIWKQVNNPDSNKIEIFNQRSNRFDMTITASDEKKDRVVTSKVSVVMTDVWVKDNKIQGEGEFRYTDSYGNKGIGMLILEDEKLVLGITQDHDHGRGMGVVDAIGEYTLYSKNLDKK